MILNERKIKILEAIINDYIRTAEPIGSRTIARKYNLGISSATIRNEMSDLEEMGFIVQPHASAGRVPSDKGYRLYVDELMRQHELTTDETAFLQRLVMQNIGQIDFLMRETAKALAILTKYTTIISEPKTVNTTVKHIQFVPLDENSIIMVLITDSKVARNHTIHTNTELDYGVLARLTAVFNRQFAGLGIADILQKANASGVEIAAEAGLDEETLATIWKTLAIAFEAEENIQIYTSGAKNILGFPEFSDLDKARAIFQTLEERDLLITLLGRGGSEEISIAIGEENELAEMKNCSVIKANYSMGHRLHGSIGIIGPTRMDYPQVVSILNTIVKNINSVLKGLTGG